MPKNTTGAVVPTLGETQAPEPTPTDDRLVSVPFEDFTTRVDEINQPALVAEAELHRIPQPRMDKAFQGPTAFHDLPQGIAQEIYDAAESDNRGRDITLQIYSTRNEAAVKEYTPPPIPVEVAEQTRLEMEAGKRQVEKHAAQQARRPRPVAHDPREGNMVPVFRPDDYVPDPKKGQGLVPERSSKSQPV